MLLLLLKQNFLQLNLKYDLYENPVITIILPDVIENIEVEEKALNLIARNSQGALRDALSILDQCISFSDNKIEYKDAVELLGTVNIEQLFEMAQSIIDQDTKKSLQILNSVTEAIEEEREDKA